MSQLVGYNPTSGDGGAVLHDGGPLSAGQSDDYTPGKDDREIWGITILDNPRIKKDTYWSLPCNYTRMDFSIREQYDDYKGLQCWLGPTTQNTDYTQYWNNEKVMEFTEPSIWKTYTNGVKADKAFERPDHQPKLNQYTMYGRVDERKDDLFGAPNP